MCVSVCIFGFLLLVTGGSAQRDVSLPLSGDSFNQILRTLMPVPEGRSAKVSDIRIVHYGASINNVTIYRIGEIKRLLADPTFVLERATTFYIHGYVELWSDVSVQSVARAYLRRGGSSLLALDWANLGFGNYLSVAMHIEAVGLEAGRALSKLLKAGLSLEGLHVVGHSMGAIIAGAIGRYLTSKGFRVPRITGLDPAYPGFYPALLATPLGASDATFVDILHTDGGAFGAPASVGHADFWPNAGSAKQPGCLPLTLPLTTEDFCSHWRSWQYWAEAVAGGGARFLARQCGGYDAFLRGHCRAAPLVAVGLDTPHTLRGNFYFRTAAQAPFALGERGAD